MARLFYNKVALEISLFGTSPKLSRVAKREIMENARLISIVMDKELY